MNGNVNENEDYKLLCSALHYKANTENLKFNEFQSIYKEVLGIESKNLINNNKIYEELISIANSIQNAYQDNNSKYNELSLPEKIVLSIAIRIELEKYLNDYYGIVSSSDNSDDNQNTLSSKFAKAKNHMIDKECKIFTKAIVSTPDFIHLNSFMYEPIVDVGFGTLVSLYSDTQNIMEIKITERKLRMYSTQQIIDKKEYAEELEELDKIFKYKKYLADNNYAFNDEIQQFIIQTINKYRLKIEVKKFYMSKDGNDHLGNQFDTLSTLEEMINQYIIIKSAKKQGNY